MSIQQSINQSISLASLLYTQTPKYKEKSQMKTIAYKQEKAEKLETEALNAYTADIEKYKNLPEDKIDEATAASRQLWEEARVKSTKLSNQLAKIDPTAKNVQTAIRHRRADMEQAEVEQGYASDITKKREKAEKDAAARLEEEQRSQAFWKDITQGVYLRNPNYNEKKETK